MRLWDTKNFMAHNSCKLKSKWIQWHCILTDGPLQAYIRSSEVLTLVHKRFTEFCCIDGHTQHRVESENETFSPCFHYFVIQSPQFFLLPALPLSDFVLVRLSIGYASIHFRSRAARLNEIKMAFYSQLSPLQFVIMFPQFTLLWNVTVPI